MNDSACSLRIDIEKMLADTDVCYAAGNGLHARKPSGSTARVFTFACVQHGDVALDDLSDFLGTELPENGRFVSLAGLLMHETGGVPEVGQALEKYGYRFIVRRADDTRLETVEIQRLTPSEAPPESGVEGGSPSEAKPSSRPQLTSSAS